MRFMGIDPGQSGGIAVLRADGSIEDVWKMPTNNIDLLDSLRPFGGFIQDTMPTEATLEFVRSSPVMSVRAAFSFGWGVGGLEMALEAQRISYSVVVPRKWQAGLGIGKTGGDKNITKAKAAELFPGATITHYIADALLIAEYARRHRLGLLDNKRTRRV